ncbi:hypothetical protein AZ008_003162, partial [Klebsiella pneumoniae]
RVIIACIVVRYPLIKNSVHSIIKGFTDE